MQETKEIFAGLKKYTWLLRFQKDDHIEYGMGFSIEENMIITSSVYPVEGDAVTIQGRRIQEIGFSHIFKLILTKSLYGLTTLEEENPTPNGVFGILAEDGGLDYQDALYTVTSSEGKIGLPFIGNSAYPCLDLKDFAIGDKRDTCEYYFPPVLPLSTQNPEYQKIGNVFNALYFAEREDLPIHKNHATKHEKDLHRSLPLIQCNRFLPNGLGSQGSAVINKKKEVIGMLVKGDLVGSGIALHVSVLRLFFNLSKIERVNKRKKDQSKKKIEKKRKRKEREKEEGKRKKQKRQRGNEKQSGDILEARTSGRVSKQQASDFILPVAKFILECDAQQICMAPKKLICFCKRLKDYVELLEARMPGVPPLLTAVKKLQSSLEHVTDLHADFLQLYLLPKCYKTGFCILEDDKFEVDQPKDLYCFYGGIICIGLKHYPKALELLHNIVTAPMSSLSVEAYKKYILVSLIHLGQFSASFQSISATAPNYLKSSSQLYIELVSCYGNGKVSELEALIQANKVEFESDHNLGLVKQVLSSMSSETFNRAVRRGRDSLEDLASRA